jgi:hypothetical protein
MAGALSGCGGGSSPAVAMPTATLSSSAANVPVDGSTILTWSSSNASGCTASGSWSGALAASGSKTVVVGKSATYMISCSGSGGAATASASVAASPMLLAVKVQYQRPGPPKLNAAGTYYVPDWQHPVTAAVPYVFVEMDDPTGKAVQATFANANGIASFSGLDPRVRYTPQIRSQAKNPAVSVDFEVLNNTELLTPAASGQGSFRMRYPTYSTSFSAYQPTNAVSQALTVTAPDGWDPVSATLVDAKRVAAPYELLAFATFEAQTVSAANGSSAWRALTILWSVSNKGGLAAPPDNYDQGTVVGSGGFYSPQHGAIDAGGTDSGKPVSEDYIYLSGDQTFEAMDIYPTIMTHEMGHFAQSLFSTIQSPGGDHGYDDVEDQTLAWIEGNASGISALVMNTPKQFRLGQTSGTIYVDVYDISNSTINGNSQPWPLGWYQETTTTAMMWAAYDPNGTMRLSAAATLAPMFTAAWLQGPWLNTIWAYADLLKKANPSVAAALDAWAGARNVVTAGNDVWGSTETNAGARPAQDTLPPYTNLNFGQTVQVCSAGAPLEYNHDGNSRYVFLQGDGSNQTHTLSAQGPAGTVPLLSGYSFTAGSNHTSLSGTVPAAGVVVTVGDCAVSYSEYSSDTAACSEPATPPAEQCWSVKWQ